MKVKILARLQFLLAMSLSLSGCELMNNGIPTVPDLIAKNQLLGENIKEAYKKLGNPQSITKTSDGQSVAIWDDAYQNSYVQTVNSLSAGPAGGVMVTPESYTSTYNHECILKLTFDKNNIITNFETHKSDRAACNKLYYGNQ